MIRNTANKIAITCFLAAISECFKILCSIYLKSVTVFVITMVFHVISADILVDTCTFCNWLPAIKKNTKKAVPILHQDGFRDKFYLKLS